MSIRIQTLAVEVDNHVVNLNRHRPTFWLDRECFIQFLNGKLSQEVESVRRVRTTSTEEQRFVTGLNPGKR